MNKKWITFLPLLMLATELPAEIKSDVERCVALRSSLQRLDCFDEFARQLLATPAADNRSVTEESEPEEEAAKSRWGLLERQSIKTDKLQGTISAVRQLPAGQYLLTLENGQIWRELEAKRRSRYRVGDEVTIRRRALGSFVLKSGRTGFQSDVKRVE